MGNDWLPPKLKESIGLHPKSVFKGPQIVPQSFCTLRPLACYSSRFCSKHPQEILTLIPGQWSYFFRHLVDEQIFGHLLPWNNVRTTSHPTGPWHGMRNMTNTVINVIVAWNMQWVYYNYIKCTPKLHKNYKQKNYCKGYSRSCNEICIQNNQCAIWRATSIEKK